MHPAPHVARCPRRRPFRLLPRLKTLADDVFVRAVLGEELHARRARGEPADGATDVLSCLPRAERLVRMRRSSMRSSRS